MVDTAFQLRMADTACHQIRVQDLRHVQTQEWRVLCTLSPPDGLLREGPSQASKLYVGAVRPIC